MCICPCNTYCPWPAASASPTCLQIISFYTPTLNWIAKWLPLFYVASLVTLPLAVKGIAGGWAGGRVGAQAGGMG